MPTLYEVLRSKYTEEELKALLRVAVKENTTVEEE